jgi:hypothetical protein
MSVGRVGFLNRASSLTRSSVASGVTARTEPNRSWLFTIDKDLAPRKCLPTASGADSRLHPAKSRSRG